MTHQIAIRIPDETMKMLDRLVAAGQFTNRTEAVRAAVDELIRDADRRAIDAAVIDGYRRKPDLEADGWLEAATRAMVSAEPW